MRIELFMNTHTVHKRYSGNAPHARQRGSAMIVSLAILTLLTVGAAFSMQRSTLQVKMITTQQYKQQVSNTTYTYIEWMMANLVAADKEILSNFISEDQTNRSNGQPIGSTSMSLYGSYKWEKPNLPNMQAVVSVTDTVTIEAAKSRQEGHSQGTKKLYYFKAVFVGRNASGSITSTMEQGFTLDAADT